MSQVQIPTHLDATTRLRWQSILHTYGVTPETTCADVASQVQAIANINTKRTVILTLRQILGREGAPKPPEAVRRVYALPSEAEIARASEGPYQAQILAMAYAGLRIGKACALRPEHAATNGLTCWIDVTATRDCTGTLKKPKTGMCSGEDDRPPSQPGREYALAIGRAAAPRDAQDGGPLHVQSGHGRGDDLRPQPAHAEPLQSHAERLRSGARRVLI